MSKKRVLAFDYGASSGRAIIGTYDGKKITLEEVHRFSNDPVMIGNTMYWDTLRLFFEMKQGMVNLKIMVMLEICMLMNKLSTRIKRMN